MSKMYHQQKNAKSTLQYAKSVLEGNLTAYSCIISPNKVKVPFLLLMLTLLLQVGANCAETIAYVESRTAEDMLIKGVPDEKNPYKGDKGGCIIT